MQFVFKLHTSLSWLRLFYSIHGVNEALSRLTASQLDDVSLPVSHRNSSAPGNMWPADSQAFKLLETSLHCGCLCQSSKENKSLAKLHRLSRPHTKANEHANWHICTTLEHTHDHTAQASPITDKIKQTYKQRESIPPDRHAKKGAYVHCKSSPARTNKNWKEMRQQNEICADKGTSKRTNEQTNE